ncbi:MAG: M14 family metallocarboxypeptidase [Phycisphaerales bacterium]
MKRFRAMLFSLLSLGLFSSSASAQAPETEGPYAGHKLVRVEAKTNGEMLALSSLGTMLECRPRAGEVHLVLSPEAVGALGELGLESEILVEDYQTIVDQTRALNDEALALRGGFFTAYQTNDAINAFTQDLANNNAGVLTRFSIGQSFQNREIHALVLTAPYAMGEPRRPQVVLNGCQHAREWVSPATVLYILNEMTNGAGVDPQIDEILNSLEIHFIPVCNPDGYVYTHTNQRLWRKNRRPVGGSTGVDLNRNWSFQWGGAGSSGSSSSETYRGPSPFSEPESTAISSYLLSLPDVHAHIDFHSFDQSILGPWAYSTTVTPPRADEHIIVQEDMAQAMFDATGTFYEAGLGTDAILGPAAGAMPDWTLDELNALSWTIELRPNSSFPGFELPPDQIIPAGTESLAAVLTLADYAARTLEIEPVSPIPAQVSSESPTSLGVSITEFNLETLDPSSPELLYRLGTSGPFTTVSLGESGGVYSGELPPVPCGQTVQFYFRASSTGGVVATLPDDAPGELFEADALPIATEFADNFQTNMGWSVSGSVTDGAWERAVPIGGGDRGDPPTDFDGSGLCYLTDAADGNSDVDGGTTIVTSPVFALPDGGTISYAYWVGTAGNFDADSLNVEVATNAAGTNWTLVRSYTTPGTSWRADSIAIGDETASSSTVRVRFLASDLGTASVIECGLDGVTVTTTGECDCPGDCDGSGAIDFNDLVAMLFEFGMPDAPATCDADASGAVDFNDLVTALFLFGPCE